MEKIIGIGEYAISSHTEDTIKTYALGSCIALTLYSPSRKVLAMAHIALPDSSIHDEQNTKQPAYYADQAVSLLLGRLQDQYSCSEKELLASVIGGSESNKKDDLFQIGPKNVAAVKDLLRGKKLSLRSEATGGHWSRTVEAKVATGEIWIDSHPFLY